MAENKPIIDFQKIKFPCEGEYLSDKEKGIWSRCLVHGFFTRGSGATQGFSLEGYWGVTDLMGHNKEIYNWPNVRFCIHRYTS